MLQQQPDILKRDQREGNEAAIAGPGEKGSQGLGMGRIPEISVPVELQTPIEHWRHLVLSVVQNFVTRVVIVALILLDILFIFIELLGWRPAAFLSLAISIIFLVEVAARLFGKGPRLFFSSILEIVDFAIIIATFVVTLLTLFQEFGMVEYWRLVVLARIIRVIRLIRIVTLLRLFSQGELASSAARHMVSEGRRRIIESGFDLDLCYITERIIAMSFPSQGFMALYRNPIDEVVRYLNHKHPNHYKVYNLCSEDSYSPEFFHMRVERYMIDDHNVPTLKQMLEFVKDVSAWLNEAKENVVAIHCKGGKGRTGTMICAYLIHSAQFEEAQECLIYFGQKRGTESSQFAGVETPSQSRFVEYFQKLKTELNYRLPNERPLRLVKVKINGIQSVGNGNGSDLSLVLVQEGHRAFEAVFMNQVNCERATTEPDPTNPLIRTFSVNITNAPALSGEVKFMFYSTSPRVPKGYSECAFYFWAHTAFIQGNKIHLSRKEVDNPHRSNVWRIYGPEFALELEFSEPVQPPIAATSTQVQKTLPVSSSPISSRVWTGVETGSGAARDQSAPSSPSLSRAANPAAPPRYSKQGSVLALAAGARIPSSPGISPFGPPQFPSSANSPASEQGRSAYQAQAPTQGYSSGQGVQARTPAVATINPNEEGVEV